MTRLDIAEIAHVAMEALNRKLGKTDYPQWSDMSKADKGLFLKGVLVVLSVPNATPAMMHVFWCDDRYADGWTYGPVRDYATKTHPSLCAFNDLSIEEQAKDALFLSIVQSLAPALDEPEPPCRMRN